MIPDYGFSWGGGGNRNLSFAGYHRVDGVCVDLCVCEDCDAVISGRADGGYLLRFWLPGEPLGLFESCLFLS